LIGAKALLLPLNGSRVEDEKQVRSPKELIDSERTKKIKDFVLLLFFPRRDHKLKFNKDTVKIVSSLSKLAEAFTTRSKELDGC